MLPIPVELHALEVVHLLLTNLALLGSNLLLNSSFRVFCKIEPWPRRNWIYLAVFLILNWYYYALEPSYLIRASVFSVVAILFLIDLLLSTVILIPKSIGFLRSLLIFLCVEYAIVHLVRIVLLLVYSRQSMDWIENNPANLFMPAATLFNVVIWATVLLLLEFYRTSEQLKSQNETLESLATIDPLTGLRNRNDFSKNLDHMIEVADRYEEPISMTRPLRQATKPPTALRPTAPSCWRFPSPLAANCCPPCASRSRPVPDTPRGFDAAEKVSYMEIVSRL